MIKLTNKVTLVLEPQYGPNLPTLATSGYVWVVDSPANHRVVEEYRDQHPNDQGVITTFKFSDDAPRLETLLGILATVDLHHGAYSSNPPYAELEVVGLPLTAEAKSAVIALGFDRVETTADGFRATR